MDNLGRDVRYAWRTLRRAPLAAATIVVTVGLGLGLVAAVYTIVNMLIFNVDEVRSPHELFGVERGVPAVESRHLHSCGVRTCRTWPGSRLCKRSRKPTRTFSAARSREIGVRLALGASSRSVGGLVLRQSAWPAAIGLGVGSTLTVGFSAALLATPAAEQIDAMVQLFDPIAYGGSLACIVAACAGAALIPAWRAGRVNPLAALRQE